MINTELYEKTPRPSLISNASLDELLNMWQTIEDASMTSEAPTVRGWIMDELNTRNSEAFNAWMDNEDYTNPELESPRHWFK